MALEFSEIATLGCMFFKESDFKKAEKSTEALQEFTTKVRKKCESDRNVQFGTGKEQFIRAMDPRSSVVLSDMCRGISAARAIKNWLKTVHNEAPDTTIIRGFMTGNVWPAEVRPFKLAAFGFKDYNSSDMILYTGEEGGAKYYYGISLKKKNTELAADPTLINKAFDTLLEGAEFNKLKEDLKKFRVKWFADTLREAEKKGLVLIESGHKDLPDAKLIAARPNGGGDKAYINLKGTVKEGYTNGMGFRKYMNKQVGQGDLYDGFLKLMEPLKDKFTNQLINVVLKTKLADLLNADRNLDKFYFGFALITGTGVYKKTGPDVRQGAAYPQESVLCALALLAQSKEPLKMVQVPNPAGDESDAAKVFFQIQKGKIPILNLELRYKGSFTAQPQFQAFLTKQFKQIINGECLDPATGRHH